MRSMTMKALLKGILAKNGLFVSRGINRGYDQIRDIKFLINEESHPIVFDVGANDGEVIRLFVRAFPGARAYCFEPNPFIIKKLERNTKPFNKRVSVFNFALGDYEGSSVLNRYESDKVSSLLNDRKGTIQNSTEVRVSSIDRFCSARDIKSISYLKIDTEGFDFRVLQGAKNLLCDNRVKFIEVEVTFDPTSATHVSFFKIHDFLKEKFSVFGFYEQVPEYNDRRHLRRVNTIFFNENYRK